MSNHTPGPWRYTAHEDGGNFHLYAGDEHILGGCGCCDSPWIVNMDNARLIAAAPELHAENERLHAEIERLRAERDALRDALVNILPLAEFGATQQSPPYASGKLIEAARTAAREAK